MIIKNEIITDLKIRSVKNLYKPKPFMEGTSLKINKSLNKEGVTVRYETDMGKQVQLDWKEAIPFILDTGEIVEVNMFVLLLFYSRFRKYRLSISKSQDILFSFPDDAFETKAKVEAPMKILDEIRAYNGSV